MVSWFPGWQIFHEPIWTSRSVGEVKKKKILPVLFFFLSLKIGVGRLKKKRKKKKGHFLILSVYYLDLLQLFFCLMISNLYF